MDFTAWEKVWVGCSGAFRFERGVKQAHPKVKVVSNDVSLLTCALGALLTGNEIDIGFTGRLEFVETAIAGAPFDVRVGAVMVALEMAGYTGKNKHAEVHFRHYTANFDAYLHKALDKLSDFADSTDIDGFVPGDFRRQARHALEHGGGVAAFPPTYKGGYERLYRFIDENTEWDSPDYDVWDPNDLESWVSEIAQAGIPYCVIADHPFEAMRPVSIYETATHKPIYMFAETPKSSFRRGTYKITPFRYTPVDADALTEKTSVQLVHAEAAHMAFLKDKYLKKGIAHTPGDLNFLVFLDGMLAGGFIVAKDKFGSLDSVYLRSDFSISRERKISKLIAMLASSRTVADIANRKYLIRIREFYTTAFTDKPVSMKYHGIFDLKSRKPGFLQYASEVRNGTPQEIYRDWFRRFARGSGHQGSPRQAA